MDEGLDFAPFPTSAEAEQQKVPCGAQSSQIFSSSPIIPTQQGDEAATAPNPVPSHPLAETASNGVPRYAVRESPETPVIAREQVDGSRVFNLTVQVQEDQILADVCLLSRLCVAIRFFAIT